ncbi:uncharacterized protein LOC143286359 [Babylonia areolata]|uniref:uncharacterized protein LOC143286359 n=1 Tax=Babylonia areolata TaxID=304850 RepID=UPI003FD5AD99
MADDSGGKLIFYLLVAVAAVGTLLIAILLPTSFAGLEYYEYGFKRQKSTGEVDTDDVYPGGNYLVGPDFEFKKFTASAHFEVLRDVTVFASDKLEVKLDVTFQYFLKKEDLHILHRNYDLYYQNVIRTSAIDALKGVAPNFKTRDFINNREELEASLFKAVRERLGGICCAKDCGLYEFACPEGCKNYTLCDDKTEKGLWVYVKYFQLGAVDIPSTVEERYLRALTQLEDADREILLQEAKVVRKDTEAKVRDIQNRAKEISQEAEADAKLMGSVATANYTAIVEKARAEGLKSLYQRLGLKTQELKNSFDYLRTLGTMENVHFTIDFQQRIVGNVGGG